MSSRKKRVREDQDQDDAVGKISPKKAKGKNGDAIIQIGFSQAKKEAKEAFAVWQSQRTTIHVKDPLTGKEVTREIRCVMTTKFLANRMGQVAAGAIGEALAVLVRSEAEVTIGLPFLNALPLPPVAELIKIITNDCPAIIGSFAGEAASETIMFVADLCVLQDKRAYYESIISVVPKALYVSDWFTQVRTGAYYQVLGDEVVNLLPPTAQLPAKIMGNVFRDGVTAILQRLLSALHAIGKLVEFVNGLLTDLHAVYHGNMAYSVFLKKYKDLILEKINKGATEVADFFGKIANLLVNELPVSILTAVENMGTVVNESVINARKKTAAFAETKNIDPNKIIANEEFERFCSANVPDVTTISTTLEDKEKAMSGVQESLDEMKTLHEVVEDKISEATLSRFVRDAAYMVFRPIPLELKTETKWIVNRNNIHPLLTRWNLNPHYIPKGPILLNRHSF